CWISGGTSKQAKSSPQPDRFPALTYSPSRLLESHSSCRIGWPNSCITSFTGPLDFRCSCFSMRLWRQQHFFLYIASVWRRRTRSGLLHSSHFWRQSEATARFDRRHFLSSCSRHIRGLFPDIAFGVAMPYGRCPSCCSSVSIFMSHLFWVWGLLCSTYGV